MRVRRSVVLLALVLTACLAATGSAAAKEVKDKGPLALVPRLDGARPPSFVGVDSAGRLVGVALTAEGELVAYVCDGEKTGVWFEGTFTDGDPTATLKGKKGASLTLDLTSDPLTGTVTIDGAEETFTLAPAVGSAGLYRERHGKQLSGWIVDNNGAIWGITSEDGGKVTDSVQIGTPSSNPPVASSAPTGDPVTTGAVKCGIAQFRLEREATKLAHHHGSGGSFSTAETARNAACSPTG
jgi:hypothetical protein